MAAMLFLGMLLSGAASHPALPPAGRCRVEGVAEGDILLREDGTAAGYLDKARVTNESGTQTVGRLYWTYTPEKGAPLPREGDAVAFEGWLYHPRGRENPYGFDFRMHLLIRGVPAGVSGGSGLAVTGQTGRGLASLVYGVREALGRRMEEIFGDDSDLPKALLLGKKSELPPETVQGFTDAGAAHILAVSGLHVALLAAVVMAPLRRILRPGVRFWVLAGFLLAYCGLLGFSAPVVRASVLLLIAAARRAARRAGDRLTALAAAFLLILLIRPLDLFSAGFQLSFCAVLGIVLMMPFLERKLPRMLRESVGISLAATAGAAVPIIQIFHRFSLIGLAINPLVCPVFALLLTAYLAVFLAGCLWLPAGTFLAQYLNAASRLITGAVTGMGALPFAAVNVPALPWYCVAAAACAAALATRFTVWPGKRKAAAAVLLLTAAFGAWRLSVFRDVQYIQLSAGQADSALILDGKETVVIDAGEYGGDTAAYLLSTGRRADHLILTHLHADHCGGVKELMDRRVPIGTVYLPQGAEEHQIDPQALSVLDALRDRGVPIRHLGAGDEIRLDRGTLTVTWPLPGTVRPGQDANRYALALLCDLDGVRLLACSDVTGDYEKYAARDADILKVAHHGSKNSTGAEFLAAVTPEIAIIPASGEDGRLPHPDTLDRLCQAGAKVYMTGETGAVTVTVREGRAFVTAYLLPKEQE